MTKSVLLAIDAAINLVLGILLVFLPPSLVSLLGVPDAPRFYSSVLGAVLLSIGLALMLERNNRGAGGMGLG